MLRPAFVAEMYASTTILTLIFLSFIPTSLPMETFAPETTVRNHSDTGTNEKNNASITTTTATMPTIRPVLTAKIELIINYILQKT